MFCRSLFVLLCFSFGHCVVCSSSIYGLWLPLWYLQTLLENGIMNEAIQFLWDIWLTWYHNQERWQNKRINKLGIANCKTRPHFLPLNYSSYHDMQNNLSQFQSNKKGEDKLRTKKTRSGDMCGEKRCRKIWSRSKKKVN